MGCGRPPTATLASDLDCLFTKMRRRRGESVNAWYTRFWRVQQQITRALDKVRAERAEAEPAHLRRGSQNSIAALLGPSGGRASAGSSNGRQSSGTGDGEEWEKEWWWEYGLEAWNWRWVRKEGSVSGDAQGSESVHAISASEASGTEVLPDELLGWLFLWRGNFSASERAATLAATSGQLRLRPLAEVLRQQFPEEDLGERDGAAGRRIHKAHVVAGDSEDEQQDEVHAAAEDDGDYDWADEEADSIEHELVLTAEEHEDEEIRTAFANLVQARRTMREAHARVKELRLARGFYRPGKGKGKGKSATAVEKAHYGNYGNSGKAGGRGNSSGGNQVPNQLGPCFHCGKIGPRVAQLSLIHL